MQRVIRGSSSASARRFGLSALLAAGALAAGGGSAYAACLTASVASVAFGTLNLIAGAAIDTTATVTYSLCGSNGTVKRNCTSLGAGNNADTTSRRMAASANRLRYELYSDAGRTILWGSEVDGYGGGVAATHDFTATSGSRLVYARILANQGNVPPGSYSDSLSMRNVSVNAPPTGCPVASGTTSNGTPGVSVTVSAACQVSATTMSFTQKVVLTKVTDASSTITLRCSGTTPWRVNLNGGLEANTAARKMRSGANRIAYGLYRDSNYTLNWGSTTTDGMTGTGTGVDQTLTIYGRVPIQAAPMAGLYADTITVTLTY